MLYNRISHDRQMALTRILLNDDLISMQKLVLCYIMENHMINKWLQTGFCLNNDLLSMQKSVLCYIMESRMINKRLQKRFYSNNWLTFNAEISTLLHNEKSHDISKWLEIGFYSNISFNWHQNLVNYLIT